jgi:tetratricopeptide (TPR) repeat protein
MIKFFIFLLFFLLYQSVSISKINEIENFNQKYLSNYFSGIVSLKNEETEASFKFLENSYPISETHKNYLKNYLVSLVMNRQVDKAIKKIKDNEVNSEIFLEKEVLLFVDSIKKKNFIKSQSHMTNLENSPEINDTISVILYETLKNYIRVFKTRDSSSYLQKNFGELDEINLIFLNCYLDKNQTIQLFDKFIASDGTNSRYIYFYIDHLLEKKKLKEASIIANKISDLDSSLLLSQIKYWSKNSEYEEINNLFSCNSEKDLIAEFFYLIASLYSSQGQYFESNFYLILSDYLNPKFYPNSALLIENYVDNKRYNLAKKELGKITKKNLLFDWFKIKKKASIIEAEEEEQNALKFVKKNYELLKSANAKIKFDMANILRNFKDYNYSIKIYSDLIEKNNFNNEEFADLYYKRGTCFERMKNYKKADEDFLNSLKLDPNDAYVLNYLGYSWLERSYKINEAMKMLQKAYDLMSNDPYITDSIGWAYFLLKDFKNAKKYLQQAVKLMPYDPIVNDHYGDVLWRLEKKIQARYFWNGALKLDGVDEEMRKKIKNKLVYGL